MENIIKINFDDFNKRLTDILDAPNPIEASLYKDLLKSVNKIIVNENKNIRPKDKNNLSGGLIDLSNVEHKIIIVPDLHARRDFVKRVINYNLDNKTILSKLEDNSVSIVFLGDGVHSEGEKAFERWKRALREYQNDYEECVHIKGEFSDSFNLMASIILLKIRYPNNIHFLKGNHENIKDEYKDGNYPFYKYVKEGEMINCYFKKIYGENLMEYYYKFEKNLPIFCISKNFVCSHSEPEITFNREDIINYRNNGKLIESLTWYRSMKENKIANKIIEQFFSTNKSNKIYYFVGHTHIKYDKTYSQVYNNELIFINNMEKEIIAIIDPNNDIILDRDILSLN